MIPFYSSTYSVRTITEAPHLTNPVQGHPKTGIISAPLPCRISIKLLFQAEYLPSYTQ